MQRRAFLQGMLAGLPIRLVGIADGVIFGVLARNKDLTMGEALAMSASIASGMAQFLLLPIYGHTAIVLLVALTLLISIRYSILGAAIAPIFRRAGRFRTYGSLFLLFDENWALTINRARKNKADIAYFVGCGFPVYLSWIGGTGAGYLFPLFANPKDLNFVVFLIFGAILVDQWQEKSSSIVWGISAVTSVGAKYLLSANWSVPVGTAFGICLLCLLNRTRKADS